MIAEENEHLFSNSKNVTDVSSIGFNLTNACLGFKNNEIKNLNINLREVVGDDQSINKFLLEIIECIKIVDRALSITTKFKSNIRDNGVSPLHTEFQICSMVASVFVNKHMLLKTNDKDEVVERKLDLNNVNENWKEYKRKFTENCLKIYTLDILQANWRGTGDKKLNSIVLNDTYYTRTINIKDFESILNLWYDNMKEERNEYQKIQSPKEAEKLILNLIYSNIFTAEEQVNDDKFDIEHLATKNCMKKQLKRFDGSLRLPVSAISNLCLLPEYINRGKGEKTIYQAEECIPIIHELESKYTFTCKEDLKWISDMNLDKEVLKAKYLEFIDNRFEELKQRLIQVLYR